MSVCKTVIENTVLWLKDSLIGLSSFYYSHNPVAGHGRLAEGQGILYVNRRHKTIMRNSKKSLRKKKVINLYAISTLLYGSECWIRLLQAQKTFETTDYLD